MYEKLKLPHLENRVYYAIVDNTPELYPLLIAAAKRGILLQPDWRSDERLIAAAKQVLRYPEDMPIFCDILEESGYTISTWLRTEWGTKHAKPFLRILARGIKLAHC